MAGRPPLGVGHVDRLRGSRVSKRRLRLILETLTGERTIASACTELGIGESHFHALRRQALEGALSGLEPRPAGRPHKPAPSDLAERLAALESENFDLRVDLRASRVRTEVAMVMPHLLRHEDKRGIGRAKAKRRWDEEDD